MLLCCFSDVISFSFLKNLFYFLVSFLFCTFLLSCRIPKTETHLKVFTCLLCSDQGKLFLGMSEESFLEHVLNQHGEKAKTKRPKKLLRSCRICEERFTTDLDLTRHVRSCHLEKGPANLFPFIAFGPPLEEEDAIDVVEVVEDEEERKGERRKKGQKSRRHSSSMSDDTFLDTSIKAGIQKVQRKRQRLEDQLKETKREVRRDSSSRSRSVSRDRRRHREGAVGSRGRSRSKTRKHDQKMKASLTFPFDFTCSICGKTEMVKFDMFEHLDTVHAVEVSSLCFFLLTSLLAILYHADLAPAQDDEAVLDRLTLPPRAALSCRHCAYKCQGSPEEKENKGVMRSHRCVPCLAILLILDTF